MGDLEDAFSAPFKGLQSVFGRDVAGILDPVGNSIFGRTLAKTVQGFTEQQPQAPAAPPTLITPDAMPTPNSGDQRKAKRKSLAEQLARKGRASTILTAAENDTLGAG